uniref:Transmembrane protein 42 n=2 Tax=Lygus hesperus TaxID=30085 RepID=A0A0K8STX6_LYGHE
MSSNKMNIVYYSVLGGALNAMGSMLGKLPPFLAKHESLDSWFVSGLCWMLMVCINSIGMMMFSKSLNESTSSFVPTLLTAASVYCASALFGVIVFSETTSPTW